MAAVWGFSAGVLALAAVRLRRVPPSGLTAKGCFEDIGFTGWVRASRPPDCYRQRTVAVSPDGEARVRRGSTDDALAAAPVGA